MATPTLGYKDRFEREILLGPQEIDFSQISDERLVGALIEANMPFIRQAASRFSIQNAAYDRDDLIQEAAIGFISAVASFDPGKNTSFKLYASRCMDNRLKSMYTTQNRRKRVPEGGVVPFSEELVDGTASVLRSERSVDPEELVIVRESFQNLWNRIQRSLSDFEREVLALTLYGCNHSELAARLSARPKQVDNALQRVRRKCRALLNDPL